ncbi:ankyrin repeat domain-containing protein [Colletotrichum kahawae]|uniref:Ankyrin repeat domain-containing protein n=1 Tax=Colletotrichum kahawae TaxID=34407 RepID=A0AAD9YC55_COLKA|nr:ankyrin repeat domain-containing protein [Colletotrichum kahawae]
MSSSHSDSDAIVIGRNDVSNYNPDQILPEPPEVIKNLRVWLQPTTYDLESGEYRKHLSSHTPGTGEWIASNSTYDDWLKGQEQEFLWIKGIPGSGKSVLASRIVRDLSQNQPGTPVLYFFFRKIIDANHEPIALLRDWLDQLLLYSPPLQKQIKGYDENKQSVNSMSLESFWKDLRMALSGLRGKAFCIVDALDELDWHYWTFICALGEFGTWKPHKVKVLITSRLMPEMEPLMRDLNHSQIQLQSDMVDIDITTYVQMRLESSDISLGDQEIIRKAIPGQVHGIFLYAKLAMDAFLKPGADAKEVLRALPQEMSAIYSNPLREHSRRSGVPEDVHFLILQWITHPTRPLSLLEIDDIIKVTHCSLDNQDLNLSKDIARAACRPLLEILPDKTVRLIHHTLKEYLTDLNRNQNFGYQILTSGETNARLGLACLSYLQAGCLDEMTPEKDGLANFPSNKPRRGYKRLDTVEVNLKYPFLAYAASNWHVHLAKSTLEGYPQKEINQALQRFVDNPRWLKTWLEIRWDEGTGGVTPLHVAARYRLSEWVKHQLTVPDAAVDSVDVSGRSPLFWAAESGWESIVKALIDAGANPDRDENEGLKPLHRAASMNHAGVVKVLLEAGADPLTLKTKENSGNWCGNASRTKGHTPLMHACHHGYLEAVEAFLPFLHDTTALHRALAWAAERGQDKIVNRILAEPGVDINRKIRGGTPLFRACKSGSAETVLLLLKKGADVAIQCQQDEEFGGCNAPKYDSDSDSNSDSEESENTSDPRRRRDLTALYIACEGPTRPRRTRLTSDSQAAREVLEAFIECGGNIHERFSDGSTLLHAAKDNPVWTSLLLERSVDPNIADNKGHTPLHNPGNTDNICQLIEAGHADINEGVPSNGKTPLFFLLDRNATFLTLKFLEYDPDCKLVDSDGSGVLHVALGKSNPDAKIIKKLIEAGADANLRNKSDTTPIDVMKPSADYAKEIWDLLLSAGADINAKDKNGCTALFRMAESRTFDRQDPHKDIKVLIERGATLDTCDTKGRSLLHEAVRSHPGISKRLFQYQKNPRLDFLISLGLDPHVVDNDGNTLLHELSWHPSNFDNFTSVIPVWKQLLNLGLDPEKTNKKGRTPLHNLSCKARRGWGEPDAIYPMDLLISRVKAVDFADEDGITPLHIAVTTSEYHAKKLLDAGANPNAATNEGMTPLHLAVRSRQSNIVGLLLDSLCQSAGLEDARRGTWLADDCPLPVSGVNNEDKRGQTPLHYACTSGRPEGVAMLLKAGANSKASGLREACDLFEAEHALWDAPHRRAPEPGNGDATGLKLSDLSRPLFNGKNHLLKDTARLGEIIDMLLDRGADLSWPWEGRQWDEKLAGVSKTSLGCGDYTLRCWTEASQKRQLGPHRHRFQHEETTFDEYLFKYRDEAAITALRNYGGIKKGRPNRKLLWSTLKRRQYYLVEELFHCGVYFFAENQRLGLTGLEQLIRGGFKCLVKRIIQLEANRRQEDDVSRVEQNMTNPRTGLDSSWMRKKDSDKSSRLFILETIHMELPAFDVLCLLVEEFGADIDEMSFSAMKLGSHEMQTMQSALHMLATGNHWWHVAQALPYLIERGANVELRNDKGQTPLHIALECGEMIRTGPFHRDAACLFILRGEDANAVDTMGRTCLTYAGSDAEMIRLLAEHGANV